MKEEKEKKDVYILYNFSFVNENYSNKFVYINHLIITLISLRVISILKRLFVFII